MTRSRPLQVLLAGLVALALLPAAAEAADAPDQARSGVFGKVGLAWNPCPFYGCEPRPLRATVVAWRGDRPVRWTDTNARGKYKMGLRRGRYLLTAHPWLRRASSDRVERPIYCPPRRIRVRAGRFVRADFLCRSGLPANTAR